MIRSGIWWACSDLNREPKDYESSALTIELQAREALLLLTILGARSLRARYFGRTRTSYGLISSMETVLPLLLIKFLSHQLQDCARQFPHFRALNGDFFFQVCDAGFVRADAVLHRCLKRSEA